MMCRRRNCQVMAEELQQSNQQRLHHFITDSKWNAAKVMDTVTLGFYEQLQHLGLEDNNCLIIDESSIPKKGTDCAGSVVNIVQAKLFKPKDTSIKINQALQIIEHVTCTLKVKVWRDLMTYTA